VLGGHRLWIVIGISKAQTTNLAVVAPGIADALLATAMGLFAAIPASSSTISLLAGSAATGALVGMRQLTCCASFLVISIDAMLCWKK
jgi:MotA/TolQ/ExbB proton channel family